VSLLEKVGAAAEPAVPLLTELATLGQQGSARLAAVKVLGAIGAQATAAVPALIELALHEVNRAVGFAAEEAFRRICPAFPVAEPMLVAALLSPVRLVRHRAARMLGGMGPRAEPVVPLLKEVALRDSEPDVRKQAAWALDLISGEDKEPV
jgi:HEAT repeat protein